VRRAVLLLSLTLGAVGTLVVGATPASAHATGGRPATDWRSTVLVIDAPPGVVQARSTDLGDRVELRVAPGHEVVVLGYSGEPYLRFTADGGVEENVRSPASYLNRTTNTTGTLPRGYDASAAPRWVARSSGRVWRWHDHRAHHATGEHGGKPFTIPIVVDGHAGGITGEVVHVAAPAPWLDFVLVAAAFAACFLIDRPRRAILALATLAAVGVVLTIGVASFGTEGVSQYGAAISYAAITVAAAAIGAAWIARRPDAWAPATLLAGVGVVVAGGFTFLGWLTHSELPAALPAALARVVVAVLLGAGAGCVVAGVRHLRVDTPAAPATQPAAHV
jgi:hypothetical protein